MLMSKKITLTVIVLLASSAMATGSYYIFFVPAKNEAITAIPTSTRTAPPVGNKEAPDPNVFKPFVETPMDTRSLPQVGVYPSKPQSSQVSQP